MTSHDPDFETRMIRLQELIRKLDRTSDPMVRAAAKEMMQCVMDLHGVAIDRMLEIVHEHPGGEATIAALGRDSLTGSLLILYGLHPETLESRVDRAIEKLTPVFRRNGAEIELAGVEDTVVRLRLGGAIDSITGRELRQAVQEQIYVFASEVTRIEGLEALGATDLIAIEHIGTPVLAGKGGS